MAETGNFRDVKAEILRRITEGPWGPGTLLPGEVALSEEFGCSRATVNRALRELNEQGLLERKRKAGTRVRRSPIRAARFEMPMVRAEIEQMGATYGYRLLSQQTGPVPAGLGKRLNLSPATPMVHVICLHLADELPFQLEDRWINGTALPSALDHDFSQAGPNEWLVATVPFSEVEISFSAGSAQDTEVAHLAYPRGAAVFRADRTTWWQGQPITHVALSYRPGYRLTTRY